MFKGKTQEMEQGNQGRTSQVTWGNLLKFQYTSYSVVQRQWRSVGWHPSTFVWKRVHSICSNDNLNYIFLFWITELILDQHSWQIIFTGTWLFVLTRWVELKKHLSIYAKYLMYLMSPHFPVTELWRNNELLGIGHLFRNNIHQYFHPT